jgi:hypothetical protein
MRVSQSINSFLNNTFFFSVFSNSGSNDLDNKDELDSGDEIDGKKIDNEEVKRHKRMKRILQTYKVDN